jgi:branched-chain amino acid transport system permease protein
MTILINGLCTGSLFGLVSAAFSFQFGALKMTNFAHGAFIMLGMYLFYFSMNIMHNDASIVIPTLLILFFFLGYILRLTLLRSSDANVQIIVTSGLAMILESMVLFIAGALPRTLLSGIPPNWKIPIGNSVLVINQFNVLTFLVSSLVLAGFALFLKKTWLGMAIRGVVQQKEAAYLMGIDAGKIVNIGYAISFIISAIASIMIALQFPLEPISGHYYQLMGFLVCLIAGMGNLNGGFFAGLLVGLISTVVSILSPKWHDAIIFTLFVILLTFFPNGVFLLKKSMSREV